MIYICCENIFSLSISVGASYVKKYFNEDSKRAAAIVTKSIHEEFLKTLNTVPWMDEDSRMAAITKANNMQFHIAYPDELVDDNKLEEYYRGLELEPDSLLHSVVRIHKFLDIRATKELRKPVNKTDWETHSKATSVNAFYAPAENSIRMCNLIIDIVRELNDFPNFHLSCSIELPAAVLQSPLFSADR